MVRGVDGVKEAVVVGRPDPRTGESVEAVVVTEPGARSQREQIDRVSRVHASPHYKVPTTVRFVEALPHGLAGKALRRVGRDDTAFEPRPAGPARPLVLERVPDPVSTIRVHGTPGLSTPDP